MRLFSTLNTAREAMVSHGAAIATVADNLANSNTPGFKGRRVEFANLLADTQGSLYSEPEEVGHGSKVSSIHTLQNQGPVEFTDQEMDFAITGEGFFVVSDGVDTYYTRAGNFAVNNVGEIVTQDGLQVMGYAADGTATLGVLNVGEVTTQAIPTSTATLTGNLDVEADIVAVPAAGATYTQINQASAFNNTVEVVDPLGSRHSIALQFFHTGLGEWTMQAYTDGAETGGTEGTPVLLGSQVLTFDNVGRQAETATPLSVTPSWGNGSGGTAVSIDLTQFTGFSSPSNVSSIISDGQVPGTLVGINLSEDGTIEGALDSGSTVELGAVAIGRVLNPDSMSSVGNNMFVLSGDTSDVTVGRPDSEGRGSVQNGALEASNLDTAKEFVDVIKYQRGYQANSQMIQTANELINTTLQLA